MLPVMARKVRVQYPGAICHVMNRGDHQERVFRSAADKQRFLQTLGEACEKTVRQIHAWCLMSNHFHRVIQTPGANLVPGRKWLLGTYTMRFNRKHKLFGHHFSGRYKALPVEASGNGYLKSACDYVHLNPARAGMIPRDRPLWAFGQSNYPCYLKERSARPAWLRVDRLLGEHGMGKDSAAGRREFEKRMEVRRRAEKGEGFDALQRGWCVGSEAFREEMLGQMKAGPEHFGEEVRLAGEQKAERLLARELQEWGLRASDLGHRRKGDPAKVEIARVLRRETTMTLGWIAQALRMGTKTHLAHLLDWQARNERKNNRTILRMEHLTILRTDPFPILRTDPFQNGTSYYTKNRPFLESTPFRPLSVLNGWHTRAANVTLNGAPSVMHKREQKRYRRVRSSKS
jgi:putative transposase